MRHNSPRRPRIDFLRSAVAAACLFCAAGLGFPAQAQEVGFDAQLERAILPERERTSLRLTAAGLQTGETLEISIQTNRPANASCFQDADVFFVPGGTVELTAQTATQSILVQACADGRPEPLETVRITLRPTLRGGRPGLSPPEDRVLSLTIPRNDYALRARRLTPLPLQAGTPMEAELELNAPAPSTVEVTVRIKQFMASGYVEAQTLIIPVDQTTAQFSFTPPRVALYTVSMDAAFREPQEQGQRGPSPPYPGLSLQVDQTAPTGPSPPGGAPTSPAPTQPPRLVGFSASPPRLDEDVRDSVTLTLRGAGFTRGAVLDVTLSSDHPQDVRFSTDRVRLSAARSSQQVRLTPVLDGQPEGREEIVLIASVGGEPALVADVYIPRHGYQIQSLTVEPQQAPAGTPVQLEVRLNAPAPADVEFQVRALRRAASAWRRASRILANTSVTRLIITPPAGDYYDVGLDYARFVRASIEPGDQIDTLFLRRPPLPRAQLLVEARRIALQTELEEGVDFLAEGEATTLTVSATNLGGLSSFRVRIAHSNPLELQISPSVVELTAEARTMTARVRALADDKPELRQRFNIRVENAEALPMGAEALPDSVMLDIPRNDYRVQSLRLTSQTVMVGDPLQVEATLNAPAPDAVDVTVQLECTDGTTCAAVTEDFRIAADETVGRLSIMPRQIGRWRASLLRADISGPSESGDQTDLLEEGAPPSTPFQVNLPQILLQAELERAILPERERASLRLTAAGLQAGETLEIRIDTDRPGNTCAEGVDAFFIPGGTVDLTAQTATRSIMAEACADGLPEPLETVQITLRPVLRDGRPGGVAPLEERVLSLTIPRNNYALRARRLTPLPLQAGTPVEAELTLNAPAPSTVDMTVRIGRFESSEDGEVQTLIIPADETTARFSFTPPGVALYTVSVEAVFRETQEQGQAGPSPPFPGLLLQVDRAASTGSPPPGDPAPPAVQPPRLTGFSASPPRLEEEAGDRVTLTLRAAGFSAAAPVLEVTLDSDHPEDVRFSTDRLRLSASDDSQQVTLTPVLDNQPEPREAIVLIARVGGEPALTAGVVVPRHGYEIQSLTVEPQQALAGTPMQVEVRLNAPAPADVELQVRAQASGSAALRWPSRIPAGASTARLTITPPVGDYEAALDFARFARASIEPGDQIDTLFLTRRPSPGARLQVETRRIMLQTELEEGVDALAEGEATTLTVSATNLDGLQAFRVRIATSNPLEMQISPPVAELTAQARTMTVQVRALADDKPELRQRLNIRAINADNLPPGVEVESDPVMLDIPRNDYRAISLRAASPTVRVGQPLLVEALLNAPAPGTVQATVRAECAIVTACTAVTADFRIAADERLRRIRITPQKTGQWEASLQSADILGPSETGDQTDLLEEGAPPPAPFQVDPRQIVLWTELGSREFREGRSVELEISASGLLGADLLRVEISDDPEGALQFSTTQVVLRAAADAVTVSAEAAADPSARARTRVFIRVRSDGSPSPHAEVLGDDRRLSVDVLRNRVPPTLPSPGLSGGATGAYAFRLFWPAARDQAFPGDTERPLSSTAAYTLRYAGPVDGDCPAFSDSVYARAAPTETAPGGFSATVAGSFMDGAPVQPGAGYCFVLEIADEAGNTARTPALPADAWEYAPDADDAGVIGLPDDLESLCATCARVLEPEEDGDGDGVNNALEAYLASDSDADAYYDGDNNEIPDIVEVRYGAIGRADTTMRTVVCDATAWLTRLSSCEGYADSLAGQLLRIVMDSGGRGVHRGGIADDSAEIVDDRVRLGAGTHWLSAPDAAQTVRLDIRPLLSFRGSEVVLVPPAEIGVPRAATYTAAVLLQGPLPRGDALVRGSVCRAPAAPEFSLRASLPAPTCPQSFENFMLDADMQRHSLSLSWQLSEEDAGKTLRLEVSLTASADSVSGHSFDAANIPPPLEAELSFPASPTLAVGAQQRLIAYLVDDRDERTGSVENDKPWRLRTKPENAVSQIRWIDVVGVNADSVPQTLSVTVGAEGVAPSGGLLLLPADRVAHFADSLARMRFYNAEVDFDAGACEDPAEDDACRSSREAFLGELSFLVGREDRDGNLAPDEDEEGDAVPASATGEKGLRYSSGADPDQEHYLRSSLGLRLGATAAVEDMGTPNLHEAGASEALNIPDDVQVVDEVALDFEVFCTDDPDCVRAGEPVQVVFALGSDIPADVRYYKRKPGDDFWCLLAADYDGGAPPADWQNPDDCPSPHQEGVRDGLGFARHDADSEECPPPGAAAYDAPGSPGNGRRGPYVDIPQTGERCVQLTITDNGLNDANPLSGVIADPGFLAADPPPPPPAPQPQPVQPSPPAPVTGSGTSSGGGGGGGGGGAVGWPTLLLLLGMTLLPLLRRRFASRQFDASVPHRLAG